MDNLNVDSIKKMISERDLLSLTHGDELKAAIQTSGIASRIPESIRDKILPPVENKPITLNTLDHGIVNNTSNTTSNTLDNNVEVKDVISADASGNTVVADASDNTVANNAANNTISDNQIHSAISDVGSNNKLINQELDSNINGNLANNLANNLNNTLNNNLNNTLNNNLNNNQVNTSFMSNNTIIIQTTETVTKNENSIDVIEKTKKCCYIL